MLNFVVETTANKKHSICIQILYYLAYYFYFFVYDWKFLRNNLELATRLTELVLLNTLLNDFSLIHYIYC